MIGARQVHRRRVQEKSKEFIPMKNPTEIIRPNTVKFAALAIVLVLYGIAQLPRLSDTERSELSSRFGFETFQLPEVQEPPQRTLRPVHPRLERISAWISAVGASVALNDLDGDGLPNDVCYVETRNDQVVIATVPGTSPRYEPFDLDPGPLPYDTSTMAPMGCLPGDLNEDGHMDLLVYYWGRTPILFLRSDSNADGTTLSGSSYVRRELDSSGEQWYTNAATLADLDGDGHVDLIIGNYFQENSGILNADGKGSGGEMQDSMSRAYNGGRNRVLLWSSASIGESPAAQFREVDGVLDRQTAHGWTLAVGAADLDGDMLPEIYFANDFGPDRLLHNRSSVGNLSFARLKGKSTVTTPNSKRLGRDSFKGMGIDFGDLNGDGLLDIYVSNIAAEYALQESHFVWISTGETQKMADGFAPYVDRSEPLGLSRSGWGWESRLGDFDNDGVLEAVQATGFIKGDVDRWPELQELAIANDGVVSNPDSWPRFQAGDGLSGKQHNPFFAKAESGRYYDIAPDLGLDRVQISRGIATADVDGDGDLDFAVANQWEPSYFYRNDSPNTGAFLGLHLLLPVDPREASDTRASAGHPNSEAFGRPAIGAEATVQLPGGKRLVAQVDGGNGHSGARSPNLHFGLGNVASGAQLPVDLRWRDPDGSIHQETLQFSPGWHTVVLGWPGER
jgi:hypothetical protein